MAVLSISQAWEETRATFAREGRLLSTVALALIGLPTLIVALIEPTGQAVTVKTAFTPRDALQLVVMLIALVGQLALVRLALSPAITVGAAITHAVRRLPAYVAAALLVALGFVLLLFPAALVGRALGISIEGRVTDMSGSALILVLAILAVCLALAVRMLMMTPVASAERGGPIHLIKRSWRLTGKSWGRVLGFFLAFVAGAIIILMVLSLVVLSAIKLTLGQPDAMSLSALALGLFQGLFNAAFTALFSVMLARIYVQLSGHDTVEQAAGDAI